jgi:predicted dehydrogenase/NADPH:quinone reductase-like Zn-dependent oxidoreductase
MKQIIQDLRNGETILEDVPVPLVRKGHLLIRSSRSLVSLGTEKMLVEFGKGSLISKARQQPDRVKIVIDKMRTEGILPTLEAVFNKLDEPLPLGYCNVGVVVGIGDGVIGYNIGDRVVSNGSHAEFVCVPQNLCAKVPENVTDDEAAFTIIASIGLQGIRLVNPTIGENVVVIGLGLIGLLTVQLLKANGCDVIGFDFDDEKVEIAKLFGIRSFNAAKINVVKVVEELTNGVGADAVLITASSKSNDVISNAAQMSRKKGRIVLVGVVGLDIQRADFFKKELTFQVSCSYGPGRYDENYELKGIDYPLSYVRWTEQRNFETILQLISKKLLNVTPLITEKVPLNEYLKIYKNLGGQNIASILVYSVFADEKNNTVQVNERKVAPGKGVIGIIGAGNFTKMNLLPVLKNSGAEYKYIASSGGLTSKSLAKKYGFQFSTTDYKQILDDKDVDLVLITTRHNLHAGMVVESLSAGKHVFVEKPLALNSDELRLIEDAYQNASKSVTLTVGFNRRFSPLVQKAKTLLGNDSNAINMIATMNAGFIPFDSWVQDLKVGGGRIIGEACHYIDLMIFLSGSRVTSVLTCGLGKTPSINTDNAIITLKFENGSQGVINYFSNGSKAYSKERIEVYSQGRTLILDNFRKLNGYGFKGFSSMTSRIDKGHKAQFAKLINCIKIGESPIIPIEDIFNTTKASFAAIESLVNSNWVDIL